VFHWNPFADAGLPDQYGARPFNPRCPFDVTVRSTAFVANSAVNDGGAILLSNGPDLNAEFDSCTFASNTDGATVSSIRAAFASLQGAA
jgi:hypothetical protein